MDKPIATGRTAEIFAWGEGRVLKLFRLGFEGGAQHEFDIACAVTANGVPAPKAFDLISEQKRPGIVYERVEGVPLAEHLLHRPWEVGKMGRLMADTHSQIHRASATGLPLQRERLLRLIEEAPFLNSTEKQQLQKHLSTLPDAKQLCHGDFHPENILLTAAGPRVIDWTDATLGHPHADVARTVLLLRTGEPTNIPPLLRTLVRVGRRAFLDAYLSRYAAKNHIRYADIQPWEVVCAAVRLREDVPESSNALLRIIRARIT